MLCVCQDIEYLKIKWTRRKNYLLTIIFAYRKSYSPDLQNSTPDTQGKYTAWLAWPTHPPPSSMTAWEPVILVWLLSLLTGECLQFSTFYAKIQNYSATEESRNSDQSIKVNRMYIKPNFLAWDVIEFHAITLSVTLFPLK